MKLDECWRLQFENGKYELLPPIDWDGSEWRPTVKTFIVDIPDGLESL